MATPPPSHTGSWRQPIDIAGRSLGRLRTFPIEHDHPLIPLWPPIEKDLLNLLDARQVKWSGLEVFRRRNTIEPASGTDDTTVVVTATKESEPEWNEFKAALEAVIFQHRQYSLKVEMVEGIISRWRTSSSEGGGHPTRPPGGTSIGIAGIDWSSGTMGGYVRLTDGSTGSSLLCALSCHHVLRPTRKSAPAPDEAAPAYNPRLNLVDRYHEAVPMGREGANTKLTVDQPSLQDHLEALRENEAAQIDVDVRISHVQELMDEGRASEVQQGRLMRMKEDRDALKRTYTELQTFSRKFGHILATSGYTTAPEGCLLDWGLIAVEEERRGQNVVPSVPRSFKMRAIRPGNPVVEMASIKGYSDEHVIVFGRTCDTRHGRYSHIESNIKWKEQSEVTKEQVFCGQGSGFGDDGDSGGFVLDQEGRLVGMLVAGQISRGVGYVTPIETVFLDISVKTGCVVDLPY